MRKLFFLPLLTLVLACGDGNPLQPEDTLAPNGEPPELTVAAAPAMNPKWEVEFTLSNGRTVNPADLHVDAHGNWHVKGLVNEFDLAGVLRTEEGEGEMLGLQYFMGDYMINWDHLTGRTRARPALFVITESPVGAGTWECQGTYKIEPYEGGGLVQYGQIAGCHGTGAFDGMKMKMYGTNEPPSDGVFHMWGEIW